MDVNCFLLCLQDQNVIDVFKKLVPNSREMSLKLAWEYYFNEHQMLIYIYQVSHTVYGCKYYDIQT